MGCQSEVPLQVVMASFSSRSAPDPEPFLVAAPQRCAVQTSQLLTNDMHKPPPLFLCHSLSSLPLTTPSCAIPLQPTATSPSSQSRPGQHSASCARIHLAVDLDLGPTRAPLLLRHARHSRGDVSAASAPRLLRCEVWRADVNSPAARARAGAGRLMDFCLQQSGQVAP